MTTGKWGLAVLWCAAWSITHAVADEQNTISSAAQHASTPTTPASNMAEPMKHNWFSLDGTLELKKAGSHGMWGTRYAMAIQPVAQHRLKLQIADFNNDQGAADDGSASSFGLGDFIDCLFGSCPDEDYSSNTGGNTFYEYQEQAAIYQYQVSRTKTGERSYGELWIGAGISQTERVTKRYRINSGEDYDIINETKEDGMAWAIDFVNRHSHWYWHTSLSGSTSSGSFGAGMGLGIAF